jgi:AraC family transcriptional regulator, activator of mtrCDE
VDWLSRLFEMMPVRGRLDLRYSYGAPWRIDQGPGEANEILYHAIVGGSAMLEDLAGGKPLRLETEDVLLLPGNSRHVMHDGGGTRPRPARNRQELNLIISENAGKGERLDLLCGHFAIAPPHDRLLRAYPPRRLVVHSRGQDGGKNAAQLAGRPVRGESAHDHLGGRAMLNALWTAMFALVLRLASEAEDAPRGLLTLAGHPRLAPAVVALFNEPARAWSLPDLARLCNMSRATLARQFQEKLGRSASDLLADIRMTLAANELRKSSLFRRGPWRRRWGINPKPPSSAPSRATWASLRRSGARCRNRRVGISSQGRRLSPMRTRRRSLKRIRLASVGQRCAFAGREMTDASRV